MEIYQRLAYGGVPIQNVLHCPVLVTYDIVQSIHHQHHSRLDERSFCTRVCTGQQGITSSNTSRTRR